MTSVARDLPILGCDAVASSSATARTESWLDVPEASSIPPPWPVAEIVTSTQRLYPGRPLTLLPRLLAGDDIDEPFELWSWASLCPHALGPDSLIPVLLHGQAA
ncbi:MAG: hypothetical protein QOK30_3264 [Nocardioidaceae bacterium]|nr:hypothetical protein [Nocardioidaceae bacterium]